MAVNSGLNIEQRLNDLWKAEDSKNLVRACLFNLIIVSQKKEQSNYFQDLIKGVVGRFPCRIIFITYDTASNEGKLDVNVRAEMVGATGLKIACELIEIQVSGMEEEKKIPFLILPNIVPDLPVYLLWTQDPSKSAELLSFLKNYISKVIFDAEGALNLKSFSQGVLDLVQKYSISVGDINWTALKGWRKIIASLFSEKECLVQLSRMKLIKIHYNVIASKLLKHNEREAIYLQAWIAAQLKCQFESYEVNEGNIRIGYQRPLLPTTFLLIPEENTNHEPGSILSIEFESAQDRAHFVLKRGPEKMLGSNEPSRQVFVHSSTADYCNVPYCLYLPQRQISSDLIEEIFLKESSQHYMNMLKKLSEINFNNKMEFQKKSNSEIGS